MKFAEDNFLLFLLKQKCRTYHIEGDRSFFELGSCEIYCQPLGGLWQILYVKRDAVVFLEILFEGEGLAKVHKDAA